MSRRSHAVSDVRHHAVKTVGALKKYLRVAGNDAYDSAYTLGKQVKAGYPRLAHNVTDIAAARATKLRQLAVSGADHLKGSLEHFSKEAAGATLKLGRSGRKAGVLAMQLGAVYALVRIYISGNRQLSTMTRKVKSHIEAKPVQSSLVALGIGYMIAKILR